MTIFVTTVWANSPIWASTPTLSVTNHLKLILLVHLLGDQSLQPVRVQPMDSFYRHTP